MVALVSFVLLPPQASSRSIGSNRMRPFNLMVIEGDVNLMVIEGDVNLMVIEGEVDLMVIEGEVDMIVVAGSC
jgi:hypothetical protein